MPKTYESLEPQGHFNFAKRVFQKIKGYIDSKVQTDVPANAIFTDTKVTQTQDNSTNDNFEILLAGSTSNTTATEEAKKTNSITFNPSQQAITIGSRKSGSTIGLTSFASGYNVEASKTCSHAEGYSTKASGPSAHSEGSDTTASGTYSHAEGYNTTASGAQSHAEGTNTTASSQNAHAEGYSTTASGSYSHAEGYYTTASGNQSHAEGSSTTASGDFAHTEGGGTEASGDCAHAEGGGTKAIGASTHAEGLYTRASGSCSHAEGYYTTASGESSHAEGGNTEASGIFAHAEGLYTVANHESQHVFGEYNIADPSSATASSRGNYVEIVGNGNSSTRSNARTLDWNGNEVLSGKLTVGTAPTNNMDVATKLYVDTGLASADEIIEITATDYDALSYAEKHNGKYYHITDRNSSNELDTKVTQTQDDSTNATYEVLLAGSTSATTATESAKKSSGLTYNPSTSVLSMSGTPSGNTDVVTKAYADGKVDKTGDTMTGTLTITGGQYSREDNGVTLDTSNNNQVTSNRYRGIAALSDKDSAHFISQFSGFAKTDGSIGAYIQAQNMKTNGSTVQNSFIVGVNKDGSRYYEVSDAAAFRDAIGTAPSLIEIGNISTSDITINTTSATTIKTITQALKKGDYIAFYTIKATWTIGTNQFRPVLIIGNDSYQGVYSYAAPQTNGSCTYLQKITVPNDGSYIFGLAGVVSSTSKIVTIPAYQVVGVLLLPI